MTTPKIKSEAEIQKELERNRYRFGGERYTCQGVAHELDINCVLQKSGSYPFPREDVVKEN